MSDAEYRLAKEAEVRCVREHGWDVTEPIASPDGVTLYYNVIILGGKDPDSDNSECTLLYSAEVETAYIEQHKLTGAAKESELDALFQCFVDIPVTGVLRSDSSKQLLLKASEQYPDPNSPEFTTALDCMETHQWAITDQDEPD